MHFRLALQFLTGFSFIFLLIGNAVGQNWTPVKSSELQDRAEQQIIAPNIYKTYHLDIENLRAQLGTATASEENTVTVSLPIADGTFADFNLVRQDVFHPDLAAKYPSIQAYTGYNMNNPAQIVKLSISQKGMDAMIFGAGGQKVFIDRYAHGDQEHYINYYKKDYESESAQEFKCEVEVPNDGHKMRAGAERYGDCTLRTFRLALACTGEYANFHGGTVESVLAEYNTAMNRVNGLYERDAAITMQIIPETDTLIFFDAATDPYTNDEGGTMLGENQTVVNARIGLNNYDIGHVFSTGGGGIASLRSPCTNRRARGVTGLGSPINDPFYVDYVAHEMGHQFGGNHCYNNSCDDNRNESTAVEPGSGATIMAYAGICAPNVQNNSDDYFHTVNLREIADFVVAGNGDCAVETELTNSPPAIDGLSEDVVIPGGTPFALTAIAVDQDNDELTYTWEQMDIEIADMPPVSTSPEGPAFRSYDPTTNPTRYFPRIENILNSTNGNTWEVLPTVDREMNFRVTVRDNATGGGCTDFGDVTLTVDGSSGPFTVTSPTAFSLWNSAGQELVTWDVANTDVAPVSCELVDILLAVDGETDFAIVLAEGVPNDGEHEISVPSINTSRARVMVRCASSVFFDINDGDFAIIAPFSTTVNPATQSICKGEDATYMINYQPNGSFDQTVTYSIAGLPAGAIANFTMNDIVVGTSFELIVTNTEAIAPGNYPLQIIGTSASATSIDNINLFVALDSNPVVENTSPANETRSLDIIVPLSWNEYAGNQGYRLQVSESLDFAQAFIEEELIDNEYLLVGLQPGTVYYWRVAVLSQCYDEAFLSTQDFQTGSLECETAENTAMVIITEEDDNDFTSSISIDKAGNVGIINVSVELQHSYIGDLTASLISPMGTELSLFQRPGEPASTFGCARDNIDASFSDSAELTAEDFEGTCDNGTDFAIQGTFQPESPLLGFAGEALAGDWKLRITDVFDPDGGSLTNWELEVCETGVIEPAIVITNEGLSLLNTAVGTIDNTNLAAESTDDEQTSFMIRSLPQYGQVQIFNESLNGYVDAIVGGQITQTQLTEGALRYQFTGNMEDSDRIIFDLVDDQNRWLSNILFEISIEIGELSGSGVVSTAISCFGDQNGAVTLFGVGGVQPYTFSINGIDYVEAAVFENLAAGPYTGFVKDSNGDIAEIPFVMPEPALLVSDVAVVRDIVTVSASGGTGALVYSADGTIFQQENTFSLPNMATYEITVKDQNECEVSAAAEVNYLESYITTAQNITCNSGNDGSIVVSDFVGGPIPYSFVLDGQASDFPVFEDLTAGTYELVVADANGVEVPLTINLTQPNPMIITTDTMGSAADISVTGGTPPYSFVLDGASQENGMFNDLLNGSYTVLVLDARGCEGSTTFEITTSTVNTANLAADAISLYPNPARDLVHIRYTGNHHLHTIEIQSTDGKLVKKLSYKDQIDISELASGAYIVKISGDDIVGTKRLIKVK